MSFLSFFYRILRISREMLPRMMAVIDNNPDINIPPTVEIEIKSQMARNHVGKGNVEAAKRILRELIDKHEKSVDHKTIQQVFHELIDVETNEYQKQMLQKRLKKLILNSR